MSSSQREVLADLRAAVNLGHPQALDLALDNLRRQPPFAANQPLEPGVIAGWLLPAGELLSRPSVPYEVLQGLQREPLTALRVIAAVAALHRWLAGDERALALLDRAAADRRPEVAQSFYQAARSAAEKHAVRLRMLADRWLKPEAPAAARISAYRLLAAVVEQGGDRNLARIAAAPVPANESENAALAELLAAVGEAGAGGAVLAQLSAWADAGARDSWLICRVLSAGWAAGYPQQAAEILDTLESQGHTGRQISRLRQALSRKAGS